MDPTKCDVTLLRFIVLSTQDRDRNGTAACDLVSELAHWFTEVSVNHHLDMLYAAGLIRDPRLATSQRLDELTFEGVAFANRIRSESDWQSLVPPHHPPTVEELRTVAARCLAEGAAVAIATGPG